MTNLRLSTLALTLLTSASFIPNAKAEELAGYTKTLFTAEHRSLPVDTHIWYPAKQDGEEQALGKNIVFHGHTIRAGATPKQGAHPIVLLSHGSGGNAVGIGWIASHLAANGMIVIAPNHQGTTSRDSHPSETVKTWERPADFTAILDQLPSLLPNGLRYDPEQIGGAGFSLGGYTMLALAGAITNKQAYLDYCEDQKGKLDCAWLTKDGLDLTTIDQAKYEQSNFDPRIKTFATIDPALVEAYTPESLAAIKTSHAIINLGTADKVPVAINGKKTANAISNAEYIEIENSSHFSFLGTCTMVGPTLIKLEGEDPICTETQGRERTDIHAELKQKIGAYFKTQFALPKTN